MSDCATKKKAYRRLSKHNLSFGTGKFWIREPFPLVDAKDPATWPKVSKEYRFQQFYYEPYIGYGEFDLDDQVLYIRCTQNTGTQLTLQTYEHHQGAGFSHTECECEIHIDLERDLCLIDGQPLDPDTINRNLSYILLDLNNESDIEYR